MKKVRKFSEEFRRQAVQLSQELGSPHRAAERLGISVNNIYGWRRKSPGTLPSPKDGSSLARSSSVEEENRRLHKELIELKKVNQILKSAAAFFSQDHLK